MPDQGILTNASGSRAVLLSLLYAPQGFQLQCTEGRGRPNLSVSHLVCISHMTTNKIARSYQGDGNRVALVASPDGVLLSCYHTFSL